MIFFTNFQTGVSINSNQNQSDSKKVKKVAISSLFFILAFFTITPVKKDVETIGMT